MPVELDLLVNNFATRSFRDTGDGDYIAARMACRAALASQFLWASQQVIEKYLKCILLLNRIPAKKATHDLQLVLSKINSSGKLNLGLQPRTLKFIDHVDRYGSFRYLEISNHAFGANLVDLDRAVWEIRRYCTLDDLPRKASLRHGFAAPRINIAGGYLESIIENPKDLARDALLWQNAFFGKRARKVVRITRWFKATNAPLFLNPQILDEVSKYVFLPDSIRRAYASASGPN